MWREDLATALRKNWPVWLILFLLFIFSGFFGLREVWRWWNLTSEYNQINRSIGEASQKTENLKQELTNLSNPVFLEKEARSRLNLKKEGEYVLTVVSDNNFPQEDFADRLANGEFDKQPGIWFNLNNWKKYFFR